MFFLHKHPYTETNNEHIYVKVNKLVNEKVEACSPGIFLALNKFSKLFKA